MTERASSGFFFSFRTGIGTSRCTNPRLLLQPSFLLSNVSAFIFFLAAILATLQLREIHCKPTGPRVRVDVFYPDILREHQNHLYRLVRYSGIVRDVRVARRGRILEQHIVAERAFVLGPVVRNEADELS